MQRLEKAWSRGWESPLLMTWLNSAIRVLSMFVILPLILNRFEPADIAVFFLFSSIITVQLFVAASFGHTFARFVGYALGGVTLKQMADAGRERISPSSREDTAEPFDRSLLSQILLCMDRVFSFFAVVSIPAMLLIGWLFLSKPISASTEPQQSWLAWLCIVAIVPFVIKSLKYTAFLQGANRLAVEQRWSAIFIFGGLLSGAVTLLMGGGLLALIAVNQVWQLASVVRLGWLYRATLSEVAGELPKATGPGEVMRVVWPAAWRSVVGTASAIATTTVGGLWFAQVLPDKPLAELLFGLRVMNIVSELCRAPFYSQLPNLINLRVKGPLSSIVTIAKRGMRRSYFSFVVLFFAAPIVAFYVLPIIKSRIIFPGTEFWLLLGAAMLLERFGSMHVNLYSTTNHIIIHWLNGITMVIALGAMVALTPVLGIYAYPVGLLIAMSSFFVWNALRFSLASIQQSFWQFEKDVFAPAVSSQALGSVALLCWSKAVA